MFLNHKLPALLILFTASSSLAYPTPPPKALVPRVAPHMSNEIPPCGLNSAKVGLHEAQADPETAGGATEDGSPSGPVNVENLVHRHRRQQTTDAPTSEVHTQTPTSPIHTETPTGPIHRDLVENPAPHSPRDEPTVVLA